MPSAGGFAFPSFRLGSALVHRPSQVGRLSPRSRPKAAMAPAVVPGWTELAERIPQPDFVRGKYCGSPTKLWETERLHENFDSSDVRVILWRDAGYWCPYCQRVQLLLELKKIPYTIHKDNMRCYGKKSGTYLAMVPSGMLPGVIIDGRLVTESLDIMFAIEKIFSGPSYTKTIDSVDEAKMQAFHRLVRLERVMAGSWFGLLRGPMTGSSSSVSSFNQTMDVVESALTEFEGPFFLSYADEGPSFIDCLFAPFVERIISSSAYWRSIDVFAGRPALTAWFSAMNEWPVFKNHRSDDLTHILALPPQIGNVKMLGPRADISTMIDRRRGLHILNDGPERREERMVAAAALVRNKDLIVADCLKHGMATGDEQDFVDIGFRLLAHVLSDPDRLEDIEAALAEEVPIAMRKPVSDSLRYMRGRCCTPRDMSVEAMEQFCGGINWLIRSLGMEL